MLHSKFPQGVIRLPSKPGAVVVAAVAPILEMAAMAAEEDMRLLSFP